MDENEAERREVLVKKRKKVRHSRGLSFKAADEVMKKFNEMAITKQKVSSKEQVSSRKKDQLFEGAGGCRGRTVSS